MFSTKDIADYYNQTIDHYEIWWNLKKSLAVHYGFWKKNTKTFNEALQNTNEVMATLGGIQKQHLVLDAGCGVGGAAFYLAQHIGCKVHGITLSQKQLSIANFHKQEVEEKQLLEFSLQDFTKTNFENETFDIIWGCESTCYANPKEDFINEAFRLLKPNGKLIIADYFVTQKGKNDTQQHLKNWADLWAIDVLHSHENFIIPLEKKGFELIENNNVTENIYPSAKRMYNAYLAGLVPSKLYNLFFKSSTFGKNHYQSGYFQYKALQDNLWEYRMLVAQKK